MIISSFKDVFRLLKLSEVCIILQGGTKAEWLKHRANGRENVVMAETSCQIIEVLTIGRGLNLLQ